MMKILSTLAVVSLSLGVMIQLGAQQQDARANFTLLPSSWPASQVPVNYFVNTNFPATVGTSAQQLQAIQDSASNWTTQTNADFSFNYVGSTSSTAVVNNGQNIVFWTPQAGNGTLAVTFTTSTGSTTLDTDIVFFGDVTWRSFDPVPGNAFDVEGVCTHEFGHALGLDHSTRNPNDTMNAGTGPGANSVIRRTLEADDIAGVESIYGTTAIAPDPMSFAFNPTENPIIAGSINMVATTANSSGGVEYFFENVVANGTGSDSSGWQPTALYTDTGVSPNGVFSYRVKARNATTLVETAFSPAFAAFTRAAVPLAPSLSAPTSTTITLSSVDLDNNPANTQAAVEVNGQFLDTSGALVATEVWATKAVWDGTVIQGLTPDTLNSVRVKARSLQLSETAFGPFSSLGTLPPLDPCAAGTVGVNGGPTGGPFDTVFVDADAGGAERTVNVPINVPFDIEVLRPPGTAQESLFTLWGTIGAPNATQLFPLGFGIGDLCLIPCPAAPANPLLFTVADGFGVGGCPSAGFGITPFTLPATIPVPLTFSMQGIIFVSGAGLANLATTNLLRVNVTP